MRLMVMRSCFGIHPIKLVLYVLYVPSELKILDYFIYNEI